MIQEIDLDGDGLIQFNEWFAWWKQPRSRRFTSTQADPKLEVRECLSECLLNFCSVMLRFLLYPSAASHGSI